MTDVRTASLRWQADVMSAITPRHGDLPKLIARSRTRRASCSLLSLREPSAPCPRGQFTDASAKRHRRLGQYRRHLPSHEAVEHEIREGIWDKLNTLLGILGTTCALRKTPHDGW